MSLTKRVAAVLEAVFSQSSRADAVIDAELERMTPEEVKEASTYTDVILQDAPRGAGEEIAPEEDGR